jgi:hypothetical protein
MKNEDYIFTYNWFAWFPVKTNNAGWVWLKTIKKTVDSRDEVYLGLLPTISYEL